MGNNIEKIQVQSVIYGNEKSALLKAIKALKQAVKIYQKRKGDIEVCLVYGDASPNPVFSDEDKNEISEMLNGTIQFKYKKFGFNSGTARGHNMMAEDCQAEYILIMNPDVILEPSCLVKMMEVMQDEKVGIAEARQTPLEHAKEYDQKTGETEWASTACTILRKKVFDEIDGFDNKTFFLYCDDLDYSWRARLAGYKIIYVPSAIVYHAKTLSVNAGWKPTNAEIYYSAEAAILLAYKWSNQKRVEYLKEMFLKNGGESEKKAVNEFIRREKEGELPDCIDQEHKIARFLGDEYCEMRFKIGK
ncbi:MAG: glycosyltransferase family 2 protein [Lachnospiraceae bacterium]|nr:glycosyltransferase family 2 protein [Lachnospiraceae bacterium]